ncbi:hypothetical protein QYF61_008585 [Mycteria americana]|uniref:Endonuclease/exonuclease/phosphatase domain-containing protein n=1 Tax=Mycteria americana TaxID=33587 RepID=A0AAN7N5D8_MYCAM|nr:hypothetical protein QYF61_008585 [Mycteria americana]
MDEVIKTMEPGCSQCSVVEGQEKKHIHLEHNSLSSPCPIHLAARTRKTRFSQSLLECSPKKTTKVKFWKTTQPNQDEEADEIFCKWLREVSQSLAFVLKGDFNLPDVCWKYNTAERKQPRRFLECVEDNFLTQLVSESAREGAPLDLLFVNREGLVSNVTVGGFLGHSNHKMIELLILGEVRKGVSRTAALDFRRADFGLFRRLVIRVPWEAVLKGKGVQEGWTFFKKEILKVQGHAIPMCQKMSWRGRRPAWLNREL